jgi:hypothetical protein
LALSVRQNARISGAESAGGLFERRHQQRLRTISSAGLASINAAIRSTRS